jgi:hypothetical protein
MNQPRTGSILAFRISSLLLIIAVIAVCLAAGQAAVPVRIGVPLFVLPALVYTCVQAYQSVADGRPMEVFDKVMVFLTALWCVFLIEFAAVIAFFMTCIPTGYLGLAVGLGPPGIMFGVFIGGLAGIVAGGFVVYLILSVRKYQRTMKR